MSKEKYFEGVGRRKSSTARVRIYSGEKASTVNGKSIEEYFQGIKDANDKTNKALLVTELKDKYYFTAKVSGSGLASQIDAVSLGLSRALYSMDESLKTILRKYSLVSRDPREVERKKYHHIKARKKPQFSKR